MNDAREEATRLAKEAGIYTNDTLPMQIDCERLVRLIALARASAAPQAPVAYRYIIEDGGGPSFDRWEYEDLICGGKVPKDIGEHQLLYASPQHTPEDKREAELLALKMADRLCKEALPKFNWGASALNANAIKLLNEVPRLISAAIQREGK